MSASVNESWHVLILETHQTKIIEQTRTTIPAIPPRTGSHRRGSDGKTRGGGFSWKKTWFIVDKHWCDEAMLSSWYEAVLGAFDQLLWNFNFLFFEFTDLVEFLRFVLDFCILGCLDCFVFIVISLCFLYLVLYLSCLGFAFSSSYFNLCPCFLVCRSLALFPIFVEISSLEISTLPGCVPHLFNLNIVSTLLLNFVWEMWQNCCTKNSNRGKSQRVDISRAQKQGWAGGEELQLEGRKSVSATKCLCASGHRFGRKQSMFDCKHRVLSESIHNLNMNQ